MPRAIYKCYNFATCPTSPPCPPFILQSRLYKSSLPPHRTHNTIPIALGLPCFLGFFVFQESWQSAQIPSAQATALQQSVRISRVLVQVLRGGERCLGEEWRHRAVSFLRRSRMLSRGKSMSWTPPLRPLVMITSPLTNSK